MADIQDTIAAKTKELEEELKAAGLWQKYTPPWVHWFSEGSAAHYDFAQWLQFIFMPKPLNKNKTMPAAERNLLVPHAIKYFGDDVQKGKLLQILIEIDALL